MGVGNEGQFLKLTIFCDVNDRVSIPRSDPVKLLPHSIWVDVNPTYRCLGSDGNSVAPRCEFNEAY